MKLIAAATFVLIALTRMQPGYSQNSIATDYYAGIKEADISKLWYSDVNQPDNDSTGGALPEPLGFIGNSYQRFYIHFLSVRKSKENPYQYFVTGKTKVKENICRFSGTINILKAGIYKDQIDEKYKQGFVECNIIFYEDSTQSATGFFKGKLTSSFYLDEINKVWYDDLEVGADGYCNNQCESVWTNYATGKNKKCNWGDYRIPQSKALDSGDGEFAVDKKYNLYGWKNYRVAWADDPWKKGTQQAREIENKQWWE